MNKEPMVSDRAIIVALGSATAAFLAFAIIAPLILSLEGSPS